MKLFLLLFLTSVVFPQNKDAEKILNKVKTKFERVKDYEVEVQIKVDMEFLRIPRVTGKIYFKQPDKMKIDSQDFAVIPKEGISFSPSNFLKKNHTVIFIKSDTLDNTNVDVIKVIPEDDSMNIILSTLWIDTNSNIIRKVETTTKNRGTFSGKLFYGEMAQFGLPSKMIFNFNIETPKIPEALKMETGGIKKPSAKIGKNLTGNIEVNYSNYKINQGLDDIIFEKKNTE